MLVAADFSALPEILGFVSAVVLTSSQDPALSICGPLRKEGRIEKGDVCGKTGCGVLLVDPERRGGEVLVDVVYHGMWDVGRGVFFLLLG